MFIKDKKLKEHIKKVVDEDIIISRRSDARTHPSYTLFNQTLSAIVPNQQERDYAWETLMEGFRKQTTLNNEANYIMRQITTKEEFNDLLSRYPDQEMEAIYKENFAYLNNAYLSLLKKIEEGITLPQGKLDKVETNLYNFIKSVVRSSNPYFKEFADILKQGLKIQQSSLMALWSGGIDLSALAFNNMKCPLERTLLGYFLDNNPLISDWALEAPLWNIISRTFIKENDCNVHIYFRLIDDASVLMRQELPLFHQVHPNREVRWHPLLNDAGNNLAEVGLLNGDLIEVKPDNKGFSKDTLAVQALEAKLKMFGFVNQRAFEHANSECFQPDHPPFALDSDLNYDMVINYIH